MRARPGRLMETDSPDTITISVVKLRYKNCPELSERGGVKENETSSYDFGEIVKFVMVGVASAIDNVVVILALVKVGRVAIWVAVMTTFPARKIVTVLSEIVAIE